MFLGGVTWCRSRGIRGNWNGRSKGRLNRRLNARVGSALVVPLAQIMDHAVARLAVTLAALERVVFGVLGMDGIYGRPSRMPSLR